MPTSHPVCPLSSPIPGVPAGSRSPAARCPQPRGVSRGHPFAVPSLCCGAPAPGALLVAWSRGQQRGAPGALQVPRARLPPAAPACVLVSALPPRAGPTCRGGHPALCGPAPLLCYFWGWWSFCMRPGHKKPRGPLIPLYDCFWMSCRRGYPAWGPLGGCKEAAVRWHPLPGASSPQNVVTNCLWAGLGWDRSHSPTSATEGRTTQGGPSKATNRLPPAVLRAPCIPWCWRPACSRAWGARGGLERFLLLPPSPLVLG